MEILFLEKRYNEIKEILQEVQSNRRKLFAISEYFDEMLRLNKINLIEAYISDLILNYLSLIKVLKIRGLDLKRLDALIDQLQLIKDFNFLLPLSTELKSALDYLILKRKQLSDWLEDTNLNKSRSLIYFPVIEIFNDNKLSGFLETNSIELKKGEKQFLINSVTYDTNTQVNEQLEIAWQSAVKYCSKYIKGISDQFIVNIKFENNFGFYTGNSFGMALLVAFIESLLKYYKSPTVVRINGVIAITGAIDNSSKLIPAGKTIIEIKTETVFFSDATLFCLPKTDEIWAEQKLKELSSKYPKRYLTIIGLYNLEDLLSRRNVVDIHKKNIIERSVVYIFRKWKSILLAALLTVFFSFFFIMDFDDNPAMFSQNGKVLFIKNKSGKVLWDVKLAFEPNTTEDRINSSVNIIDINNDALNEVLICDESIPATNSDIGRIVCYDKKKNVIWKYKFRDSVSTFRQWTNSFIISLIDTITIDARKVLFLLSRNTPNFPSAVFQLDLLTGKRFDSLNTLWNAGTITNGIVGDFNEDGQTEIVLAGIHNGFQRAILFSVNIDKIGGQTPSPKRYEFNNINKVKLNEFILLPFSDYGKLNTRANYVPHSVLFFNKNSEHFEFLTCEDYYHRVTFHYAFDKDLNFKWVDSGDNSQVIRDSLVAKGILQKPFTNTPEYFEILRQQIEYWDGEKFINIDDRKK